LVGADVGVPILVAVGVTVGVLVNAACLTNAAVRNLAGDVRELPVGCVEFRKHTEIYNDVAGELHYTMDRTAASPTVHPQVGTGYQLPSGHCLDVIALGAA
jgi:hypothetical protein